MDSQFVKEVLIAVDPNEQEVVRAMFANYKLDSDKFEDNFEVIKYRLSSDNDQFKHAPFSVQAKMIID